MALNKTVITGRYTSHSELTRPKQKDRISTKILDYLIWKNKSALVYTCPVYTNEQQETLPAKVKGEKKIAQEGIQRD